jgi:hypothetical protein
MTSVIFAVIMACSPPADAQNAQIIASKPDTAVEEPAAKPRIHEPEKAVRNFRTLLKKGKLTLPGIVIEDVSDKKN